MGGNDIESQLSDAANGVASSAAAQDGLASSSNGAAPPASPSSQSSTSRPPKKFSLKMPSGIRKRSDDDRLPQHHKSPSSSSQNRGRRMVKAATVAPGDEESSPHAGAIAGPSTSVSPPLRSTTISPPMSPSSPEARTVFNKFDRPELESMDSYVVGARSPILSPGGINLPRVPFSLPRIGAGDEPEDHKRDSAGLPFRTRSQNRPQNRSRSRDAKAKRRSSQKEVSTPNLAESQDGLGTKADREQPLPIATKAPIPRQESQRSEPIPEDADTSENDERASQPITQRLADLHEKFPYLKQLQKPILPLVAFPGQGSGASSEFAQEAPLWSRQPYKILYLVYFGLSIGLIFLPWFAFISLFPSKRPRKSWTWKRSTLVKLYRHGTRLTFRTHTQLSRDLTKEVPHNKTIRGKFVWVDALSDDLIRGDVRRMMELQGLAPRRTCGFWYGERDGGGGVGQKALPGERVVYHLHGGAYWIGTAHEKDVTAAVNMQVLKALDRISRSRATSGTGDKKVAELCKRTFSVDYRLCVPGRPEIGSFPAPLLDALAGYRYLTRVCNFNPEDIIVAGDSAGGNLGLALCRYLRDEGIDGMPGAMILLSPWADTSRSHSGPTSAPNKFSTVWVNRKSDIISPSLAFRNTAVSALLGKMEARETYKNPYLSSCSLQLNPAHGGAGPAWGYQGFPKRIYICTGTAELNHDQHITLAYRLASGSHQRVPVFADGSDESCDNLDPFQMAARLDYPRPHDHEIMLWPSAQNTPVGTPIPPPQGGTTELQHESSRMLEGDSTGEAPNLGGAQPAVVVDGEARGTSSAVTSEVSIGDGQNIQGQSLGLTETGNTHGDGEVLRETDPQIGVTKGIPRGAQMSRLEAGSGDKSRRVKEKDTDADADATKKAVALDSGNLSAKRQPMQKSGSTFSSNGRFPNMSRLSSRTPVYGDSSHSNLASSIGLVDDGSQLTPHPLATSRRLVNGTLDSPNKRNYPKESSTASAAEEEPAYFAVGGEDRIVTLDVCKDAVHDYTLFNWYEPERGHTWARIAQWIDEQV